MFYEGFAKFIKKRNVTTTIKRMAAFGELRSEVFISALL